MENKNHQIKDQLQLTNESLSGKFKSQFELVNYAIRLADNFIRSGRPLRVTRQDTQNPAALILEEITQGKDAFEEIPKEMHYEHAAVEKEPSSVVQERKKTRRLL